MQKKTVTTTKIHQQIIFENGTMSQASIAYSHKSLVMSATAVVVIVLTLFSVFTLLFFLYIFIHLVVQQTQKQVEQTDIQIPT